MMLKMVRIILLLIIFSQFLVAGVSYAATAEDIMTQVKKSGEKFGGGTIILPQQFIAKIIQILLGTVGIVFIILVFYGGYELVTAGGDEEKAKKALKIIQPAVIGLLIILMAYGITTFVASKFKQTIIEGVELSQ